jgi:hypothetical protein
MGEHRNMDRGVIGLVKCGMVQEKCGIVIVSFVTVVFDIKEAVYIGRTFCGKLDSQKSEKTERVTRKGNRSW